MIEHIALLLTQFFLVYHRGLASSRPDVVVIHSNSVDIGFQNLV